MNKFCAYCGTKLNTRDKFCSKCGNEATKSSSSGSSKKADNNTKQKPTKQTYGLSEEEYDLLFGKGPKVKTKDGGGVESVSDEPIKQTYGMSEAAYDEMNSNGTKSPKLTTEKKHTIRNVLVVIGIISAIYLYPIAYDATIVVSNSASASVSIRDIADNSGFNLQGKSLFYQTSPELVTADAINNKCPNSNQAVIEFGCYIPKENKIYILEVADSAYKEIQYATAAHEMLHVAWRKLSSSERSEVNSLMRKIYDDKININYQELHDKLAPYGADNMVINDELHSFIGSETPSAGIGTELEEYYNKYFDNRSVSVYAQQEFDKAISNKISQLQAQRASLDKLNDEIDIFKRQYIDTLEAALNRARYYGDSYSYNKNYDIYSKNYDIYKSKVNNYNTSRNNFNAEVDKFNAVLKAFYPSRAPINQK